MRQALGHSCQLPYTSPGEDVRPTLAWKFDTDGLRLQAHRAGSQEDGTCRFIAELSCAQADEALTGRLAADLAPNGTTACSLVVYL